MTPLFLHGAASADMTGWSAVLSALLDGLKDGLLSIPILFLAYLLMELLERKLEDPRQDRDDFFAAFLQIRPDVVGVWNPAYPLYWNTTRSFFSPVLVVT